MSNGADIHPPPDSERPINVRYENGANRIVWSVAAGSLGVFVALLGWSIANTAELIGDVAELRIELSNDHKLLCDIAIHSGLVTTRCHD